jgi:shikimate dehydrogenase
MRVAAVVGHPVAHSRSPLVHGHWLAAHGVSGAYLRLDVAPADAPAALRGFDALGLVGANVTLPHKELAAQVADELDAAAAALGAANTLWLDGGRLHAANTDVEGFLAALDADKPGWDADAALALVLGAGGAARAVAFGLLRRGFERVTVANRTLARAEALAAALGPRLEAVALGEADRALAAARLVVNTTSLGMRGEGEAPLDWKRSRPGATACDIVYVPLETPFLASARRHGLATVDGLGMLLHQAVPGFERWFGVRPRVTPELRALVAADIAV